MLDAHRARCGNPASGPIFANSLGKPLCLNNLFNRVIAPALEQCSCSKRRGEHVGEDHAFKLDASAPKLWQGWHAFRRGLATNLYRLRVPDKTIQAILRHANLHTTLNVYVKSVEEDSVKAMNALEVLMCAKRAPEQPEQVAALPN